MAHPRESQTLQPWVDDGQEPTWDTDVDDDDLFLDEFADDDLEVESDQVDTSDKLAPWRLIEIARENKYLESVLADFDQYDEFEYYDEDLPSEYSN